MMQNIGVISDTHHLLREPVKDLLRGCDAIVHAGDIGGQDIACELSSIAPFYAVCGNIDKDKPPLCPQSLSLELFGLKLFVIHQKNKIQQPISDKDIIIYGHSHKYEQTLQNGQIWLNPGSCGPKRFSLPVTMAVIHIDGKKHCEIERIDFLSPIKKAKPLAAKKDLRAIIINVMRDTDKGKSVAAIAKHNHISEELATQICRLYLTHPGVTADGILTKMGLL